MNANLAVLILAIVVIGIAIVIGYLQKGKDKDCDGKPTRRRRGSKTKKEGFDMKGEFKELALLQAEVLASI